MVEQMHKLVSFIESHLNQHNVSTFKLNVLLGKVEHSGSVYDNLVSAYVGHFKTKQGMYKGETKTYTANPDTVDIPAKRGNTPVGTTVGERLAYFVKEGGAAGHVSNLLNIEATNASGTAKARLKVGDVDFGELSSIELMRLKGVLEKLKPVYDEIPIRSDAEEWKETTAEQYHNRDGIFEGPKLNGTEKTTVKEPYILADPNVVNLKDTSKYLPVQASKDTVMVLGEWTHQKFSGELSPRQKADILARRSQLLEAVIVALKQCNDAEVVESQLSGDKLFNYLHG